jgi:hypothetical protein
MFAINIYKDNGYLFICEGEVQQSSYVHVSIVFLLILFGIYTYSITHSMSLIVYSITHKVLFSTYRIELHLHIV